MFPTKLNPNHRSFLSQELRSNMSALLNILVISLLTLMKIQLSTAVLSDKRINMSSRIKILEACVRSPLLYSAQSWELTGSELNKHETIWAWLSKENGSKWIQTQKCSGRIFESEKRREEI